MEYYLAVLTFTFVGAGTPGPNNLMLLASGVNYGVRRSLPHYFGICIGFPAMALAVALGLGALFIAYPALHLAIKVAGIAYLLYLAWKIANMGNAEADPQVQAPLTFWQAAVFQWVNPKAWVIIVGAIATFTVPGRVTEQLSFLIFAFALAGFVCMAIWLTLGVSLQRLLEVPKRRRVFNVAMALLLVASVIPMALTEVTARAPQGL